MILKKKFNNSLNSSKLVQSLGLKDNDIKVYFSTIIVEFTLERVRSFMLILKNVF